MDNETPTSDSDAPNGPDEMQTDPPKTDEPIVDILEPAPKRKRGVGFGAVFFMSLLAALAGAAGGGALSRVLNQDIAAGPATNVQAEVAAMTDTAEALTVRLETLEAKPGNTVPNEMITDLEARLSAIEARPIVTDTGTVIDPDLIRRLEALENAPAPEPDVTAIPDIEARLAAIETNLASGNEGAEAASLDAALLARLEAIENQEAQTDPAFLERLSALENAELPIIPDPVDLSPLLSRLDALEARTAALKADVDKAAEIRASIPLPAFPREDIVAAMSAVADEDTGWIGRTLGKHVRVRDESLILIVDDIEALVLQGDARAALARVNDLPEEGRAAAQDWVAAVKAQRTSL